jgi:hypothetical protein
MATRVSRARLLMVEGVVVGEDEFGARAAEGIGEGLGGFHPAIDSDTVDVVGNGGRGESATGGQCVGDALLDRGEERCGRGVFHCDDESSMGVRAGAGISGAVYFIFMEISGDEDW